MHEIIDYQFVRINIKLGYFFQKIFDLVAMIQIFLSNRYHSISFEGTSKTEFYS